MSRAQSSLGAENYEKYRNFIKQSESGNNYIPIDPQSSVPGVNRFGFAGAYQVGAAGLEDAGFLKKGSYAKFGNSAIYDDKNWERPGGLQGFLNDPKAQDQAFDKYTANNYNALVSNGVIKPGDPPDSIAGNMAAAHLLGAEGFKRDGLNGADGFGTKASKYYKGAASTINGSATEIPPTRAGTGKIRASKPSEPRKVYNGSDRTLGNSRISNTVKIGSNNDIEDIKVPIANPLSSFSSFNSVITLSCITPAAHSDPKNTYKAGFLGEIILSSAGAGSFSQSTAMTSKNSPSGRYDFYIDNLDINSIITFNKQTKGSNATDISFEVIEPYSMGVFLQACEVASTKNGWPLGYLNAIFLLTIEFIGYDDNGNPIVIPNTTRNIPMSIRDISMTIKHGGARYTVKGVPSNEIALDNNNQLFEVDLAVSGKTVQEVLQSGEFSLQTVINKRLQEFAQAEKVQTAFDEIVIVFPKVEENNGTVSAPDNSGGSAVNRPSNTITVSRKTSASNLIQDAETLNKIGSSIMDFDSSTGGESQVNKQDDVQPDPKSPVVRSKVVYDAKTRQFIYSQGTSIVNAISSILVNSKYCKEALEKNKSDDTGMIDWFRIETQVEYQIPKEGNLGNNNIPKLLIFKIVPYKVHGVKNSSPSAPAKGYDRLKNEAAKVYDYIYTGKNTEILNFDIEFKHAFFNTIAADQSKMNKQLTTNGQQSATTDQSTAQKTVDNKPIAKDQLSGNVRTGRNLKIDPDSGGTISEDQKTRIAKVFQRALYESETDLVNATMTVAGDPYFLADSGMGNFSNRGSGRFNITESYAMDYQSGEVDIIINFRTPLDYDNDTGIINFGNTEIVEHFSGLYRVDFVNHRFQKGKFTQELKIQRRPKQSATPVADNPAAAKYVGSEALVDETGQVSSIRRNLETGELYDGSGLYDSSGRAIADPKSTTQVNKTTTVAANSTTPAMTDADKRQLISDWTMP